MLTDTARLGIMRFFDGWNPQRAGVSNTATPTTTTRVFTPSMRLEIQCGRRSMPTALHTVVRASNVSACLEHAGSMPAGTWFHSPREIVRAEQPSFPPGGATFWDANRQAIDSTRFVYKMLLQKMPQANHFGATTNLLTPAGLNTATVRWLRARAGSDIDNNGIAQTTTGLCRNAGFSLNVVHEVDNVIASLTLVTTSLGLAFCSSSMQKLWPEIVFRPLQEGVPPLE